MRSRGGPALGRTVREKWEGTFQVKRNYNRDKTLARITGEITGFLIHKGICDAIPEK